MKKFTSLLIAFLMLFQLAACGGETSESSQSGAGSGGGASTDEPITLSFATSLYVEESHQIVIDELLEKYKEVAPNVTIEIYGAGYADYWNNITTEIMAGNEADIMQMYPENVATYHSLRDGGVFIDMGPYLEGTGLEEKLIGQDACVFDGVTLALASYAYGTTGIYYRRSMLEEAGVDPDSILTWEDFKEASAALTHDDQYAMGILTSSHSFVVSEWVRQLARIPSGGVYFPDNESGPYTAERINVNSDAVKWAAKEWQDYLLVDQFGKPAPDKKDSREYFWHGLCAFNHDGPWFVGMTEASYPELMDDIGVIAIPDVEYEGKLYKANPWHYPVVCSVSQNCENVDAAMDFLFWMSSVEAQRIIAKCGSIPTNKDYSDSEEYISEYPINSMFNTFMAQRYSTSVSDPPIPQLQALEQVMIDAAQAMFAAGEDVDATLDAAAESCRYIMEQ